MFVPKLFQFQGKGTDAPAPYTINDILKFEQTMRSPPPFSPIFFKSTVIFGCKFLGI
ncbi:hypothetical protein AtDm6_2427 [Acetobacter tropicalis]|uniref:Uncharacterized protein n=1 Tax=Acetobacter tropicalis TaxID=104102 RepID=A0A094ZIX9_9PROT|nr:hypothetical protein AtDm6_2427 [Acetobacter tropicalis]